MFLEPGTSVFATAGDSSLELALDDYLDTVGEAEMAMEHISRMRDMLKGMDSLSDRGLKFVRISLEGWGNYLKLPSQCRPSLEGRGKDNLSLALEESEGFFASIWEGIKNIFKWIANTFKKIFGMDEDGGGSGNDTSVEKALDTIEANPRAVVDNTRKAGGDTGKIKVTSFKIFGVTGGKFEHATLNKKLADIALNIEKFKGFALLTNNVMVAVETLIDSFKPDEDAGEETYKALLKNIREQMVQLEKFFSDFPTASSDQASTLGTDEGKVYNVSLIPETVSILVKFSAGDVPKLSATNYKKIPDNALDAIDVSDLGLDGVKKLRDEVSNLLEKMNAIRKDSKRYVKAVDAINKKVENVNKKQLASSTKSQKDFVSAIHTASVSLVSMTKLFYGAMVTGRNVTRLALQSVKVTVKANEPAA